MPPLTSAILRPLRSPPYSFLCPKNLTSAKPLHFHCNTTPRSDPIFSASTSPLPSLRCRCAAKSDGTGPSAEDMVSDMVEKLLRREENKELLDGLEEASARVERAREALADIERQEADALRAKEYVRQLQFREAEIAESQRELLEARTKVEEAQQSLSANMVENYNKVVSSEAIDRHKERLESGKAALVSSLAGSLASVPISLYQATSFPQLILHLVVISFSCALFGVTFRYTVRRDLDNFQLKTGTCAAFGFIKGLSAAEVFVIFIGSMAKRSVVVKSEFGTPGKDSDFYSWIQEDVKLQGSVMTDLDSILSFHESVPIACEGAEEDYECLSCLLPDRVYHRTDSEFVFMY